MLSISDLTNNATYYKEISLQQQTKQQQLVYRRIGLGINVRNMGNIDLKTGYTYLDFNLFFREDISQLYSFEEYQQLKNKIYCDDYMIRDDAKPLAREIETITFVNMASVHLRFVT